MIKAVMVGTVLVALTISSCHPGAYATYLIMWSGLKAGGILYVSVQTLLKTPAVMFNLLRSCVD